MNKTKRLNIYFRGRDLETLEDMRRIVVQSFDYRSLNDYILTAIRKWNKEYLPNEKNNA